MTSIGPAAADSRRGQTLLVGAISLAVLFVSLALVLNTAIYGSTLASQATVDVKGGDTSMVQVSVERDVEFLIESAIENQPTSISNQQTYVNNNVTRLEDRYQRFYGGSDRIVTLTRMTPDPENQGTEVTDSSGGLITTASFTGAKLRSFNMRVTSIGSTPLEMVFTDGADTYRVSMQESGTDFVIELNDPSGSYQCSFSSGTPYEVNITDGAVDGEYCRALDFFERIDSPNSYDFDILSPGDIDGQYRFVTSSGSVTTTATTQSVIYSTDVRITQRAPGVHYVNTIEAAPGEPA